MTNNEELKATGWEIIEVNGPFLIPMSPEQQIIADGFTKQIESLRAQLTTLQQEAIEREALVNYLLHCIKAAETESLKKGSYADIMQEIRCQLRGAEAVASLESPNFASRVLELVRADFALENATVEYSRVVMSHDDGNVQAKEQAYQLAVDKRDRILEALTPEDIKLLGVE